MKYQQWASFEKHLAETPGHPALVYIAVSTCAYERRLAFAQIVAAIHKKEPHAAVERVDGGEISVQEVIDKLNSRSLFGGPTLLIVDGIEKLKKAEMELLSAYVGNPAPFSFLALGSSSSKPLAPLYQKGKRDLIGLDLSEEKPWERKSRLQRHLVLTAQREGKTLSSEAVLYLLDHVSLDLAALEQEMEKLICFCAGRNAIGKEDVQQICAPDTRVNAWQLSEALIWEGKTGPLEHSLELSWLLPFIGQLRYQLQIGLQLCGSAHLPSDELQRQFPQLRGPMLAKRLSFVKERGVDYFRTAAHLLFEMEISLKNSGCTPALALDLFIAKLKNTYDPTHTSAPAQFIG